MWSMWDHVSSFQWLQVKEVNREEEENEERKEEVEGGLGFDDPFFQHDVAMATTVSGISCHLNVLSLLISHIQ